MFKWQKLGRIFNPLNYENRPDWMSEYTQSPTTIIFNDFVRVFFCCRSKQDKNSKFVSYSAYVDLDKKNLSNIINIAKAPLIKLGRKGCFDEFGTYPLSVIREKREIWAYYAGWTRCGSVPMNTAIGFAKSNDNGETFEKLGEGPVLAQSIYEPTLISGPRIKKFNNKFYLFYLINKEWLVVNNRLEFSSKIRLAISDDGLNWNKLNKNLIVDIISKDESQASPDVIYKNGKYHMFFCFWDSHTFRETKNRRIGYATSNDLINWDRDDSKAGIDISEGDAFDNEMIAYPHVFELDGKIYMLYLGNEVGRYGFGLAELEGELK